MVSALRPIEHLVLNPGSESKLPFAGLIVTILWHRGAGKRWGSAPDSGNGGAHYSGPRRCINNIRVTSRYSFTYVTYVDGVN